MLERVDVGEPVDDDSSVEIQQVTSDEGIDVVVVYQCSFSNVMVSLGMWKHF